MDFRLNLKVDAQRYLEKTWRKNAYEFDTANAVMRRGLVLRDESPRSRRQGLAST
jgi:hypothetical protein